ncbi:MAG: hypothetical protein ACJ780_09845 [Solirubrobacteraceae bacterium]|jgi:hypothetical protein
MGPPARARGLMELEEIRSAIARALRTRPPKFNSNGDRPVAPSLKVAAFEDYLLDTAYLAAELEESLFWLDKLVAHFTEQIDHMTGYEMALPRKPKDRITAAETLAAKRTTDPVTFEAGTEAKALRATALRQIDRFRFEAQFVISRGYTLITGS